jgi:hypothetical protein
MGRDSAGGAKPTGWKVERRATMARDYGVHVSDGMPMERRIRFDRHHVQTGDDAEGGPATGTDATQEPEDDEDDEPVGVRVRVSRDGRDVVIKLRSRLPVASIVEKIKEQAEVRSCPYQLLVAAAHNTDMVMTQPTCHKSKPVMFLHCNDSKNEGQADKRQLDSSSRIRLVYGGRVYQDNEVLESHPFWDFANDYVINALVLE